MAASFLARPAAPLTRPALFLLTALAVLTLLGLCPRQAGAATYYVSPSGNDGNAGTSWATAKQHVQAGVNAESSGDQVWVAQGTYVENVTAVGTHPISASFAGDAADNAATGAGTLTVI